MQRKLKMAGAAAIFATSLFSLARAAEPGITGISVLPVNSGLTSIRSFTPDGRDGAILKSWRDNGNAHGYTIYMVMIPNPGSDEVSWSTVGIEKTRNGPLETEIDDLPHTGEDNIQSVAFARGKVDGVSASLVIIAEREMGMRPIPDPAPTTIRVYRLVKVPDEERLGSTPWLFKLIKETRAKTRYCNAELALSKEMALPLSPFYNGPNKADGC